MTVRMTFILHLSYVPYTLCKGRASRGQSFVSQPRTLPPKVRMDCSKYLDERLIFSF